MTRILLVETASPKRVRKKAEAILAGMLYPEPRVSILCAANPKTVRYFQEIPGIEVIAFERSKRRAIVQQLRNRQFDIACVFWTGERRYRRMKLAALRLGQRSTDVDIGDGGCFRLTWKAIIRHALFRWRHQLPTDHWQLVSLPDEPVKADFYDGERILIVQSADPPYVLRALERLKSPPLFRNPRYILFCRNRPEVVRRFSGHPMIHQVRTHAEIRDSWRHLRELRRERFDAVVVFFTGDPSYWKIKYFAFALGARHKLIFNENNDCLFFSLGEWLALLAHRMGERSRSGIQPRWTFQARILATWMLKLALFPLRFIWLLLVWLRLRSGGWRAAS